MPELPPFDEEVSDVLRAFLASVTIPINYHHGTQDPRQLGTGTLFVIDDRLFLITAAHLFDDLAPGIPVDPGRLMLPTVNCGEFCSLGPYKLIRPGSSEFAFDIAVLELQDVVAINRARAS